MTKELVSYDLFFEKIYLSNFPIVRIKINQSCLFQDIYLWSKCIKRKIYKKAIAQFTKEKYSVFMTSEEDTIINFIIFQVANSFIFIPKYGILRIEVSFSANKRTPLSKKNIYFIHLLDAVFMHSKNTIKGKEIILNIILRMIKMYDLNKILNINSVRNYFNSILLKIYKSKYIIQNDKILINKALFKYNSFNLTVFRY